MMSSSVNRLPQAARTAALLAKQTNVYVTDRAFRRAVDEVLHLTQPIVDEAIDSILKELRPRPPKPPYCRYFCASCGSLDVGKPHRNWLCRLFNGGEIVGRDEELVFDEDKWDWVKKYPT